MNVQLVHNTIQFLSSKLTIHLGYYVYIIYPLLCEGLLSQAPDDLATSLSSPRATAVQSTGNNNPAAIIIMHVRRLEN